MLLVWRELDKKFPDHWSVCGGRYHKMHSIILHHPVLPGKCWVKKKKRKSVINNRLTLVYTKTEEADGFFSWLMFSLKHFLGHSLVFLE